MTASRRWPDTVVGLLLFAGLLALYVAVQRASIASYDGTIMSAVARRLVDGHTLMLTPVDDTFGRHLPYAHFGIGISLVVAPLYAIQRHLDWPDEAVVTLANPLLLAMTGVLLHRLGRAIGLRPAAALAAPLLFGYLTLAVPYSTELFSEPGVALALTLLLLGLVRWQQDRTRGPLLTGCGFAIALLFRTDSALLVGVALLTLPLFVPIRRLLRQPRRLLLFVVPVVAAAAWTSAYSLLRDGTPIPQTYGGRFSTPLVDGLRGLLVSPGMSFFVYNPVLALALPGLALLWRRHRPLALAVALLAVARLVFYARWQFWSGGVAWGPRFLMPLCAPLSLAAGLVVVALPRLRPWTRLPLAAATLVLVAAGAAATYLSVASRSRRGGTRCGRARPACTTTTGRGRAAT